MNFTPHYSLEDLTYTTRPRDERIRYAIPMVCFCDIPLSQIGTHADHYGEYAIGLTKQWGQENGVSPVLYYQVDSRTAGALNGVFGNLKTLIFPNRNDANLLAQELIYFTLFTKPYEGTLVRPHRTFENVRFYDEREWRHVPTFDRYHSQAAPYVIEGTDFLNLNRDLLRGAHEYLSQHSPLVFEPKFIRYLIVSKESEILQFMDEVLLIKGKYSEDDKRLLTTRIVSMDQILEDY